MRRRLKIDFGLMNGDYRWVSTDVIVEVVTLTAERRLAAN